ncbi:MAG: carboxylesterase family protein [Clostridia bacterium]|nr:carboxylesterase family protein [Clostridia bacterium]
MKFKKSFIVFLVLFVLIFAVLLELGKNTLLGWAAFLALSAGFVLLHGKVLNGKKLYLRLLAFVAFVVISAAVFSLSGPPEKLIPAVDVKNPEATEAVSVKQGMLSGVYNGDRSVEVFAGIPYAKPPVGELRWKEPQQPDSWQGVRACDYFAPMSMQKRNHPIYDSFADLFAFHRFKISLKDNYVGAMSEDSLYLNIWKPAGDVKNAPVLFFIHGGSLTGGQTWYSEYNGEAFARQGIIVVNCAYRLNVFGYYANEELKEESPNGTTGNYGLLDQIAALKWVNENIESFGGDKDNITIAGESAGSSSVNAICVSPLAKGLFTRAIAESSSITPVEPYHTFRALDEALEMGENIQKEFSADNISQLRDVPAEKLVNTSYTNSAMTVDGYAITEQPYLTYEKGENNEQALLNGFNEHESDLFFFTAKVNTDNYEQVVSNVLGDYAGEAVKLIAPYEQSKRYSMPIVEGGGNAKGSANRIYTAAWFQYSHYNWSTLLSAQGKPVYEYYFTKENKSLGSNHAGEMPYAYGNLGSHADLYDETDRELSRIMQQYWINFIKSGDPNAEGLPKWKKFNDSSDRVLNFDKKVEMIKDPNYELYQLIDKYQNTKK